MWSQHYLVSKQIRLDQTRGFGSQLCDLISSDSGILRLGRNIIHLVFVPFDSNLHQKLFPFQAFLRFLLLIFGE